METFMVSTGFYDIVTRKEAEKRLQHWIIEEDRRIKLERVERADKGGLGVNN